MCFERINETVVIGRGAVLNMECVGEEEVPEGGPPSPPHPSSYSIRHVGQKSQRCIGLTSSLETVTHLLKYRYKEENVIFKLLP